MNRALNGKPVVRFPADVPRIGDPGSGNAETAPFCADPSSPLCPTRQGT